MIKTEGENDRNVAEISPLSFFCSNFAPSNDKNDCLTSKNV